MIIYFSGTGNSKYVAEFFAEKLCDEAIDAGSYIKNEELGIFSSNKPYIFVAPTYCWRIPHIFRDFLEHSVFEKVGEAAEKAYFVMTCGSDIGCAGKYNERLCKKMGLTYMGTLEVIMPENYIAMFPVPENDEADIIINAATQTIEGGIRIVQGECKFPMAHNDIISSIKSGPVNPLFYTFAVKAKPFYATDACIGCGKCAESCVLNNIELGADDKPIWGDYCTHCMACICGCLTKAIEYGKKSQGKPRYTFPDGER